MSRKTPGLVVIRWPEEVSRLRRLTEPKIQLFPESGLDIKRLLENDTDHGNLAMNLDASYS